MPKQKQIFHDVSGRRRKYINILLSVFLVFIIVSAGLIAFSLHRLNSYENIAKQGIQKSMAAGSTALLYTDNHGKAYAIANSQISRVSTVIVPRYLLTREGVSSPTTYLVLNNDINAISEDKNLTYKKYFLLSSTNYSNLPLDRSSIAEVDASLPTIIDQAKQTEIIEQLKSTDATGLIVDIDPSLVLANGQEGQFLVWLNDFKSRFRQNGLKVGVSFKPTKVSRSFAEKLSSFDLLYISQDYSNFSPEAASNLASLPTLQNTDKIVELPTVSMMVDSSDTNQYLQNVDYASIQDNFVGAVLSNRSAAPHILQTSRYNMTINDAVSNYNYMHSIVVKNVGNEHVKNVRFSVANPGFEEFSVWNVLPVLYDPAKTTAILTNQVEAEQNVTLNGVGQLSKVADVGHHGSRKLTVDENGVIVASQLENKGVSPVVTKFGSQRNKIAITFDDGPNPESTPKVLDILDAHGVKGTFFALGTNVKNYPNTAREIVARGHEIENHSYDHPIFSQIDLDAQAAQIEATSKVIHEVTGQNVKYFRKPYSDNTAITSNSEVDYLQLLGKHNLISSEYDIDSKDWSLKTADEVVAKVIRDIEASEGNYSQILFHDTHHNPAITYQALPQVIEYLKSKNIEILRVDELGEQRSAVAGATTTYKALQLKDGWATVVIYINLAVLGFAALKYAWMIFGTVAYEVLKKRYNKSVKGKANKRRYRPELAVIIACYNEENVIGKTIEALQANTYKKIKIVIVNDGSKDSTLKIIKKYAKKDKRIKLYDIPNGGKAAALSYAIKKTRNKWLIFCDADTVFAPDALQKFAAAADDDEVGAVAGKIVVGNDNNLLTRSQFIEYCVSHRLIKTAQDLFNSIIVVPGAAGMWRRSALMQIGGFTEDTLAEDADATMKIIAAGYRVRFLSDITAHTEAPESVKQLHKQRTRWQLGNMQALFKHREGLFKYKYKLLGFVGLPMFYIELLSAVFFPFLAFFTITLTVTTLSGARLPIPENLAFVGSYEFIVISSEIILLELVLALVAIVSEPRSQSSRKQVFISLIYYLTVYKVLLSYATIVSFSRALRGTLQGWGHLKRTASVGVTPKIKPI